MSKKNEAREREIRRRQKQAQERPRSTTLPSGQVGAVPTGAELLEQHKEWSYFKVPATGAHYVKVQRKDGTEQVYTGAAAFAFHNLSLGFKKQKAIEDGQTRHEMQGVKGKLYVEALREHHLPQAMEDQLTLFLFDQAWGAPRPLFESLPSAVALMVANCLDGKPTQVFGFEDVLAGGEPMIFTRRVEEDGTVVVDSHFGTMDLFIAPDLTLEQRRIFKADAEAAQRLMSEDEGDRQGQGAVTLQKRRS
jgi:hypothetical protein